MDALHWWYNQRAYRTNVILFKNTARHTHHRCRTLKLVCNQLSVLIIRLKCMILVGCCQKLELMPKAVCMENSCEYSCLTFDAFQSNQYSASHTRNCCELFTAKCYVFRVAKWMDDGICSTKLRTTNISSVEFPLSAVRLIIYWKLIGILCQTLWCMIKRRNNERMKTDWLIELVCLSNFRYNCIRTIRVMLSTQRQTIVSITFSTVAQSHGGWVQVKRLACTHTRTRTQEKPNILWFGSIARTFYLGA